MTNKMQFRKFKLDIDLAQLIFNVHGLGKVSSIRRFDEGMVNDVFSINDKYVIKVNSAHIGNPKLSNEAAIYQALRDSEIPVPKLYVIDNSCTLIPFSYMIMEQVAGESLENSWFKLSDCERLAVSQKLGRILGIIHSTEVNRISLQGSGADLSVNATVCSRVREISARLKPLDVIEASAIKCIEKFYCESSLFNSECAPTLIHGNFRLTNVIFDKNLVSGIIDWEWASWGCGEEEFAVTLYRGLSSLSVNEREIFKKEYLSVAQVSAEFDNKYLPYVLLYYYQTLPEVPKWTHRPDKQKEYVEAVKDLAEQIGL